MKNLMKMMTILFVVASLGFAGDMTKNLVVGFDGTVVIGKVLKNGNVLGLSPGIGIGYKHYFVPLKKDALGIYGAIGTDGIYEPFLGAGVDYKFKIENLNLYAGLSITSRLAVMDKWPVVPMISIGIFF